MGFWAKIREGLNRFMAGRNGADQLSAFFLYAAIVLNLLALFPALSILSPVALALLVYTMFRMLSRNLVKRRAENAGFLTWRYKAATEGRQAFARLKNMKTYRYFRCPNCRARLRLKRGSGEGTMTCGKCGHSFKQRA